MGLEGSHSLEDAAYDLLRPYENHPKGEAR